jgi:nicotinate phosphoribosyltransferase
MKLGRASLYTDLYELTMAQGYFLEGRGASPACFDYFFRKLPFKGGYVLFTGLQDVLEVLEDLRFSPDELGYLRKAGFKTPFLDYLSDFRFRGSVTAAREGEVVFPNEPLLKVEGNVIETQLVETLLLNYLNFQSLIATKASRLVYAAQKGTVMDFGLRRAQGLGGIHASRAAVVGGAQSTSNVFSGFAFGLKVSGTMAHSWVETYGDDLTAFRAYARLYPDSSVFLVDTYNTLASGVPAAITVAHELAREGHKLQGIRLDSGDLAYLSKQARHMLDAAGLGYVKIVASNQLDEHIIKSLLEQGAPIDIFGVGTNLVIGKDDAALDGVYKLTTFDGSPRIKISENIEKVVLPGSKKVLRYMRADNTFYADAVTLDDEGEIGRMYHPYVPFKSMGLEDLASEELLQPVMTEGRSLVTRESPYEIAAFAKERLARLPEEHKRFEYPHIYKVGISARLMELRDSLLKEHVYS